MKKDIKKLKTEGEKAMKGIMECDDKKLLLVSAMLQASTLNAGAENLTLLQDMFSNEEIRDKINGEQIKTIMRAAQNITYDIVELDNIISDVLDDLLDDEDDEDKTLGDIFDELKNILDDFKKDLEDM